MAAHVSVAAMMFVMKFRRVGVVLVLLVLRYIFSAPHAPVLSIMQVVVPATRVCGVRDVGVSV